MKRMTWVMVIALMIFTLPAAAEFYKYLDKQGNVRFTDDINQVPLEQRQDIKSYVGSESAPEPASPENEEASPASDAKPEDAATIYAGEKQEEGYFEKTRKELDAMKTELDAEYKAIMEEKENLTTERETAKSRAQIQTYNQKVEELNERAAAYEKKGAEYSKLVDEFNAKVAEENQRLK